MVWSPTKQIIIWEVGVTYFFRVKLTRSIQSPLHSFIFLGSPATLFVIVVQNSYAHIDVLKWLICDELKFKIRRQLHLL